MPTLNKEQLEFFLNEILGQLGWDDDVEATGIDPLIWAKAEIGAKDKLAQLRDSHAKLVWELGTVLPQLRAELDKKDAALEEARNILNCLAHMEISVHDELSEITLTDKACVWLTKYAKDGDA